MFALVVPQAMIEQVVPSKACLGVIRSRTLGGSFADSGATEPQVPPGFTCVVVQRKWPVELSSARFLRDDDGVLDAAALLRAQKLESLQLKGTELEWQTLAKLPTLRELDAGLRQRLFLVAGSKLLSAPALAPHLPRLLLQAMAGSSAEWRSQALHAVAAGKGAGPTEALRAVLATETVGVDDREAAALELIKRKDAKSFVAARALYEGKTSAACVEVVRAKAR
jgi:hypothetical protein